jgi:hypothetical protein
MSCFPDSEWRVGEFGRDLRLSRTIPEDSVNDGKDARSGFDSTCAPLPCPDPWSRFAAAVAGYLSSHRTLRYANDKGESMYIGVGAVVLILIVLLLIGVLR